MNRAPEVGQAPMRWAVIDLRNCAVAAGWVRLDRRAGMMLDAPLPCRCHAIRDNSPWRGHAFGGPDLAARCNPPMLGVPDA
jgi:hypothetical protein